MLDIIIVNWNSGLFLEKCILSILETPSSVDFRIIVVDNDSTDGYASQIPLREKDLLINAGSNLGFAKACNLGASRSGSEFILFLNPDTVIDKFTIQSAISFLNINPSVGILGVRQETDDGDIIHSCSRFLRLKYLLNDVTGLSKMFPHKFKPATIMTDWNHNQSTFVDQVMGSFMMLRRSDFKMLGSFDEQFFMYFEDMDIAKRTLALGKKSYYNNEICIKHKGCGSSDTVKDKRLFYSLTSRVKYARKHMSRNEWFLVIFVTIFPEFFTRLLGSIIRKGSIEGSLKTIRAYFLFIAWLVKGR